MLVVMSCNKKSEGGRLVKKTSSSKTANKFKNGGCLKKSK